MTFNVLINNNARRDGVGVAVEWGGGDLVETKRLNLKCTRIRSADPQMSYDQSEITFLWFHLIQLANQGSVLMCPPPDGERAPMVPSPCLEQDPLSFEPVPREPPSSAFLRMLTSSPRCREASWSFNTALAI